MQVLLESRTAQPVYDRFTEHILDFSHLCKGATPTDKESRQLLHNSEEERSVIVHTLIGGKSSNDALKHDRHVEEHIVDVRPDHVRRVDPWVEEDGVTLVPHTVHEFVLHRRARATTQLRRHRISRRTAQAPGVVWPYLQRAGINQQPALGKRSSGRQRIGAAVVEVTQSLLLVHVTVVFRDARNELVKECIRSI